VVVAGVVVVGAGVCKTSHIDNTLFSWSTVILPLATALPGHTLKTLVSEFQKDAKNGINPLKILAKLKLKIAPEFFQGTASENAAQTSGPREIILSEYLVGK
jgi:hypothetical protein